MRLGQGSSGDPGDTCSGSWGKPGCPERTGNSNSTLLTWSAHPRRSSVLLFQNCHRRWTGGQWGPAHRSDRKLMGQKVLQPHLEPGSSTGVCWEGSGPRCLRLLCPGAENNPEVGVGR